MVIGRERYQGRLGNFWFSFGEYLLIFPLLRIYPFVHLFHTIF